MQGVTNYPVYPANQLYIYIQANLKATLATETLIASEEAVIAAAASEAIALAKAALKVAKDAALLVKSKPPVEAEYTSSVSSKPDALLLKWIQHMEAEDGVAGGSHSTEAAIIEDININHGIEESDDVEPTHEELECLQDQLSSSVAVKSRRQTERKAKRARAAERAATNDLSYKFRSTSKKKRASSQQVDHTDPLRYIRATTSTSRLLTPAEEIQLSEGIQVCDHMIVVINLKLSNDLESTSQS